MLVLDVTNAHLVIMGIPIANRVVVQNEEVHLPFVMHQENVPAYLVLLEEHANNAVQDIINILNANVNENIFRILHFYFLLIFFFIKFQFVIVIVKDRLVFRAIMKENVCVSQILWEPDVINARKVYTIFLFVKV